MLVSWHGPHGFLNKYSAFFLDRDTSTKINVLPSDDVKKRLSSVRRDIRSTSEQEKERERSGREGV